MKKQIAFCGLAAACILAYASSEKIALMRNSTQVKSIRVENIREITYSGDAEGFSTINFNMLDGSVSSFSMDDFDRMEYTAPLPENPVYVEVQPHHVCATLTVTAPEEGVYYRITGAPLRALEGVDEGDWVDHIIRKDMDYVQSVADYYGRPLSSFPIEQICESGSQVRDWYPDEVILDNTPIALVVYTAEIKDDALAVTTEPRLIRFDTKKMEEVEMDFSISADLNSNTVTVKADALPGDAPFAIELYSKEDIEVNGLENLVKASANQYTMLVYNYGMEWTDVTYKGHGERTWTNRAVGEELVAVVFGCEYGIVTTGPKTVEYEVPEPEITDDCTFDVVSTQLTPGEISLKITPSNPDTRYVAFLVEGDKLASTTPSRYVGNQIKWYNNTHTITWDSDEYVYTGENTITTHDGVIAGEYLSAGEEYYVLICGITPDGTRTTDIRQVECITSAEQKKEVTFSIEFGKRKPSGSYAFQSIIVKPSDPEAKYVIEHLPSTNEYANLSYPDDEFMQRYIDVQGKHLTLYTGDTERQFSFQKVWDSASSSYVWGKQIIFVFGYDGVITSPLYLYELDTATGQVTQLRGPGADGE